MTRKIFLLVASLLAAFPLAAAPCLPGPLSGYMVSGFECDIDSATFSDFDFFAQGSITTTELSPDDITVSPLQLGGQIGLRFAGDFESSGLPNGPGPAEGNLAVMYRFFYEVTRPNSLFTLATVVLNDPFRFSPNPLKFGGVLFGKHISNDGATAIVNDQDLDLMESGLLNTPRQTITIDDTLTLVGGASAAGTDSPVGFVTLESADNLFAFEMVVPEPGTLGAVLSGIALLLAVRRRRHR